MTEPSAIIINSYSAANTETNETLIKASANELMHCKFEHGVLNMYPGCVMSGEPEIDAMAMTVTYHLGYTLWREELEQNCPLCGCHKVNIKDWGERTVKDCTLGPFAVILKIRVPKVICCGCDHARWLKPSFVHPHHRITLRLYGQILQLLDLGESHLDLKKISAITAVEADIIRNIDKARLIEVFKDISLEDVRNIAIDEISVKKHHKYISVIIDADTRRLLYAAYGRKKDDLRPFFDRLKELGLLDQIEGAVMDGNCGYQNLVKELCPNAKIVLDLFHCLQQFNSEVADAIRLDKIKDLRKELGAMDAGEYQQKKSEYKKRIKDLRQSKWLTYMGSDKLNTLEESQKDLVETLKQNKTLFTISIFGDHIRDLWHSGGTPEQVETAIKNLYSQAEATEIPLLIRFCKKLKDWSCYIIHAATTGLNTSILEGCNAKFKTIKRVAYGFRDIGYYILKMHQALSRDRKSTLKATVVSEPVENNVNPQI